MNLGFTGMGDKKTHGGGTAPKYFAGLQLWFATRATLTKTIGKIKTELGIKSRIRVTKNRLTGKRRTVDIDFYHSFGFDDLGSCVDYLVSIDHWKKAGGKINAEELNVKMKRERLIHYIEEMDEESELRRIVGEIWRNKEEEFSIHRKRRYI
jgi:hypothetical protein